MEIRNLDELQKLNLIDDDECDVELCPFTCLVTCKVTGISSTAD